MANVNNVGNERLLGQGILQGKQRTHEHTFNFTEIDPDYIGKFKFHHPSLVDRMNIGVLKAQMLQGLPVVDVMTDNIAHMSSTLTFVLDEFPEWFKINEIYDYELLEKVYDEYTGWVNSFRKPVKSTENEGNSSAS